MIQTHFEWADENNNRPAVAGFKLRFLQPQAAVLTTVPKITNNINNMLLLLLLINLAGIDFFQLESLLMP